MNKLKCGAFFDFHWGKIIFVNTQCFKKTKWKFLGHLFLWNYFPGFASKIAKSNSKEFNEKSIVRIHILKYAISEETSAHSLRK